MRHQNRRLSINVHQGQRNNVMSNLVKQIVTHGRIETTESRARLLAIMADKIVTLGKKNTIPARRQAYKVLKDRDLVKKLFDQIAPKFADRKGGYTRMLYKGFRKGDSARIALVEFVQPINDVAVAAPETNAADEGKSAKKAPKSPKKAAPKKK